MGQLQGKSVALRLASEALPPSYMACRNMKSVLLLQLASWEDKQVVESVRCLQQPKRVTFGWLALLLSSTSPSLFFFSISPSILHDALEYQATKRLFPLGFWPWSLFLDVLQDLCISIIATLDLVMANLYDTLYGRSCTSIVSTGYMLRLAIKWTGLIERTLNGPLYLAISPP